MVCLEFDPQPFHEWRDHQFEDATARASILGWLDAQGPLDPLLPVRRSVHPYLEKVYLNVPYNESLPAYRVLRGYPEHPDGTMRHAGVRFYVMSLDHTTQNAGYDEPGFCKRWAKDF